MKTTYGIKKSTYDELPKWAKDAVREANKKRAKERLKRGGQASMEFLMTYGWAILVVIAAIGALAYFGVLDSAKFAPESCTIMPGISCDDFRVTDTGRVEINILNGKGQDLTGVSVSLTSSETEETLCTLTCVEGCSGTDSLTDGSLSKWSSDECSITEVRGNKFKGNILFAYSLTSSGLSHSETGELSSKVEEGEEPSEPEPLCGGFSRDFCPDMTGPGDVEDGYVGFDDMMYFGMVYSYCYETNPTEFAEYYKADFNQDCCVDDIDQACFSEYYGEDIDCTTFTGTCPV